VEPPYDTSLLPALLFVVERNLSDVLHAMLKVRTSTQTFTTKILKAGAT
jgi:hypothetical protein